MIHHMNPLLLKWLSSASHVCSSRISALSSVWLMLGPDSSYSPVPLFSIPKGELDCTSSIWGCGTWVLYKQAMVWVPLGRVLIPYQLHIGQRWVGLQGIEYRPAVARGRRYPSGWVGRHSEDYSTKCKWMLNSAFTRVWNILLFIGCWATRWLHILHIALVTWIITQLAIDIDYPRIFIGWSFVYHSGAFHKMIHLAMTLWGSGSCLQNVSSTLYISFCVIHFALYTSRHQIIVCSDL